MLKIKKENLKFFKLCQNIGMNGLSYGKIFKNAEKNYFGKTVAFSFFCLFCCTLITDRIRNSSPVNSDGSKPV